MKSMEQITPAPTTRHGLVRVAAYARISMVTDRTPVSLSTQVSYYQKLITSTPGWTYAGVFADAGITGTTTARPQFQELLALARSGKVDLILTKSISRFSRNTLDLLVTVRELKDLGVEVRFEKENISSMSADGELMLTLLASFAQAESEQLSQNVKWRVAKQFEQGLANGFHHYGYTTSPNGADVQIIEEEAEVIRRIYRMYLEEISCEKMVEIFAAEGIRGRSGEPLGPEVIRSWLKAELFTGTLTLGRSYCPRLGQHSRLNKGEKPMYRVTDAVPAIITPELFDQVQRERARRKALGARANWSIPTTCFTSTVVCGWCGRSYSRTGKRNTCGQIHYVWVCRTKRDGTKRAGGRACSSKMIPEPVLQEHLAPLLGLEAFDPCRLHRARGEGHHAAPAAHRGGIPRRNPPVDSMAVQPAAKSWTPQRRAAWSAHHKELWADPDYRQRVLAKREAAARARRATSQDPAVNGGEESRG